MENTADKIRDRLDEIYKRDAMCDGVLLCFEDTIKEDCTMPNPYLIEKMIQTYINRDNVSKELKEKLLDIIIGGTSEKHSLLSYYMTFSEDRIIATFFYGHGTFYKWYDGEKEKAQKRVEKHLSSNIIEELKDLKKCLKIIEKPKEFDGIRTSMGFFR